MEWLLLQPGIQCQGINETFGQPSDSVSKENNFFDDLGAEVLDDFLGQKHGNTMLWSNQKDVGKTNQKGHKQGKGALYKSNKVVQLIYYPWYRCTTKTFYYVRCVMRFSCSFRNFNVHKQCLKIRQHFASDAVRRKSSRCMGGRDLGTFLAPGFCLLFASRIEETNARVRRPPLNLHIPEIVIVFDLKTSWRKQWQTAHPRSTADSSLSTKSSTHADTDTRYGSQCSASFASNVSWLMWMRPHFGRLLSGLYFHSCQVEIQCTDPWLRKVWKGFLQCLTRGGSTFCWHRTACIKPNFADHSVFNDPTLVRPTVSWSRLCYPRALKNNRKIALAQRVFCFARTIWDGGVRGQRGHSGLAIDIFLSVLGSQTLLPPLLSRGGRPPDVFLPAFHFHTIECASNQQAATIPRVACTLFPFIFGSGATCPLMAGWCFG